MNTQKPFNWSNVIMIALLVVVVLIPLFMSISSKKVDSWTRAINRKETIIAFDALKSLEDLKALEGLPELQVEMDSILASIEIPEMDSFLLVMPEIPFRDDGKNKINITIKKSVGFPSFEAAPTIIGGYDALLEHLDYPEKLKKKGIEGTVIVQIHVEKDGSVSESRLLKSSGHDLFDESALHAITKITFNPVTRDDEPVDVWLAMPVIFKLKR